MENSFSSLSALNQQVAKNNTLNVQQPQQVSFTQRPRSTSASSTSSTSSFESMSSRRSLSPPRAVLSEKNTTIGSIVFLPRDDNTEIRCAQYNCGKRIQFGALNHPAVVLRMWYAGNGEIMTLACIMSGNPNPCPQDKARNLPISREHKGQFATGSSTYQTKEIIYLENPGTLTKQSYIQVKHIYVIPLSKLRPFGYDNFENRLSQESYSYLMSVLGQEEVPWTPTEYLQLFHQLATHNTNTQELTKRQGSVDPMDSLMNETEMAFSSLSISTDTATNATPGKAISCSVCENCHKYIYGTSYNSPGLPDLDYCYECVPFAHYIHPGNTFAPSEKVAKKQVVDLEELTVEEICARLIDGSLRLN